MKEIIVECDGETQRHEKSVLRTIHRGSDEHFTRDLYPILHQDIPGKCHQNHWDEVGKCNIPFADILKLRLCSLRGSI